MTDEKSPKEPLSKLDAYMARKSAEVKPAKVQSNGSAGKKKNLVLIGFLMVIAGSFLNGLMMHFEVGGILGMIAREILRFSVLIGLFLILASFFRKFWKLILILFILLTTALIFINTRGHKESSELVVADQPIRIPSKKLPEAERDWSEIAIGVSSKIVYEKLGEPDETGKTYILNGIDSTVLHYGMKYVVISRGKVTEFGHAEDFFKKRGYLK